jgi:phosphate transport system substrate-binding protein
MLTPRRTRNKTFPLLAAAALVVVVGVLVWRGGGGAPHRKPILNRGSDTMVNVAQVWAEEYAKVSTNVAIEVAGGGSGVGIAALIDGTVALANSSRPLKPSEIAKATEAAGKAPVEFITGYDALAIYVHKDNPLDEITLPQLAELYGEGGHVARWSDLGVTNALCKRDRIIRISRQSSSGTYDFFREIALGKRDFKLGTLELNGSKEVVELVAHTPCAIGYSGMGYAVPGVKMLRVGRTPTGPFVAPTVEATHSRAYPIARPLLMYTLGDPDDDTRDYIDWIMSPAGQEIVARVGYVPLVIETPSPGQSPPPPRP